MYIIENIVLNSFITHKDRAFVTKAKYQLKSMDGVFESNGKLDLLLYSKNYLKKKYSETECLFLTNEQRLKSGLIVMEKKIKIKDNEMKAFDSNNKRVSFQIAEVLRDMLVVNPDRQFAYGICSDADKFILVRIERRTTGGVSPLDFTLYKTKQIMYDDNGLWWLHQILNQPIHFYGLITPFEVEYIPRGLNDTTMFKCTDIHDERSKKQLEDEKVHLRILESASADKEGIEKPKLGRSGMVHILKDQLGNLYCAKEFRISEFYGLINECQKISLFQFLTMIKKKIKKTN
jgi:hypothetical protein